jgi:hypothetical protein
MTTRLAAVVASTLLALCACDRAAPPAVAPAPAQAQAPKPAAADPATPATMPTDGMLPLDATVIAATDTLATLRARLGEANVIAATVPGAEGAELSGWILYPDDPPRHAYVYLDDAGTHPLAVRVMDEHSRWQRADGIHIGLDLAQLVQRNGAPIRFMGFDWDYGGGIIGWNGGALERDPPLGGVTLCPPPTEAAADPDYPAGDAEFDSSQAWVVAHPPVVCEFSLNLEPPASPGQEATP